MSEPVLSDTLLEACAQRAAGYDRENQFFTEDLADLRSSGYLLAAMPKEFGGLGLAFTLVCHEQRRLARRSAPTALGVNMHLGATGMAADLYGRGDRSQAWILKRHGTAPSSPTAIRIPATIWKCFTRRPRRNASMEATGSTATGTLAVYLQFGTGCTPMASDPDDPKMVFGVIARDAPGYRIVENWDTLGMRATQSHDTILEGVFVPDRHIISDCQARFRRRRSVHFDAVRPL